MNTKNNSLTLASLKPIDGLTIGAHSLGMLREFFHDRWDFPEETHGWLRNAVEAADAERHAQAARIAELEGALAEVAVYLRRISRSLGAEHGIEVREYAAQLDALLAKKG